MKQKKVPAPHPGEILLEEFMKPLGVSQYRLSKDIHVSPMRINEIIHGKRSITADTAFRLGIYLKMTPQFWLGLQNHYDLAKIEDKLENKLYLQVKPYAA